MSEQIRRLVETSGEGLGLKGRRAKVADRYHSNIMRHMLADGHELEGLDMMRDVVRMYHRSKTEEGQQERRHLIRKATAKGSIVGAAGGAALGYGAARLTGKSRTSGALAGAGIGSALGLHARHRTKASIDAVDRLGEHYSDIAHRMGEERRRGKMNKAAMIMKIAFSGELEDFDDNQLSHGGNRRAFKKMRRAQKRRFFRMNADDASDASKSLVHELEGEKLLSERGQKRSKKFRRNASMFGYGLTGAHIGGAIGGATQNPQAAALGFAAGAGLGAAYGHNRNKKNERDREAVLAHVKAKRDAGREAAQEKAAGLRSAAGYARDAAGIGGRALIGNYVGGIAGRTAGNIAAGEGGVGAGNAIGRGVGAAAGAISGYRAAKARRRRKRLDEYTESQMRQGQ